MDRTREHIRQTALPLALALAALTVVAAPGWAQPAGGPGMHQRGAMHEARHGGAHEGRHAQDWGGPGAAWLSGRALEMVKATPEQRARIREIMDSTRRDLAGRREARRATREEARRLFSQPEIDAAAVEVLRQKMSAEHEQTSKRRMQAMLEVARVLTPEQRRQLAEFDKRRGEMRERHRRERESMAPGRP